MDSDPENHSSLPVLKMEEDHVHCMSCVNQRCMTRPQPGMSCDLVTCPLVCGAVFHSCKADEHHLLCPLLRVPCLNSGYGCPATLVRNQMYAHLEVCPAGVVCCTMEWNRWPISCFDYTSYESLSRGVEEAEQLDMALALQDQRTLLESLKVIAMAPSAKAEPRVAMSKESCSVNSVDPASEASPSQSSSSHPPSPPTAAQLAKQRIASGINGLNEEHFSKLYEATVETARTLAAALEYVSGANGADCVRPSSEADLQNGLEDQPAAGSSDRSEVEEPGVCSSCLKGADVTIVNATNGPLSEGLQTASSAMEQDDTDAGVSQEPEGPAMAPPLPVSQAVVQRAGHVLVQDELQNQHSSRVQSPRPCYSPHKHFPERQAAKLRPKMEDKAVDTSGLDQDDDSMGLEEVDLITAALLFCLEESRECRRISDTVYVDSYRVDFGTQTFTFPAAILVTNTRVGDMASASACDHAAPQLSQPSPFLTLRLGLVLEALEVEPVPHNRYLPPSPRYQHMFPFVCGQSFRRDQFSSHFTNVHGDIHAGLNGWMEHRCPLAYYGCTFSQRRFYPTSQGAKVVHDRHLRSFGVQPCPRATPPGDSQPDHLSGLPMEILWLLAGFLDSFSLCQLSLVSRTMREVCAGLLQTRGIVDLQWERRQRPGAPGTVAWQVKNKVWRFSTAFSPVRSWRFSDLPSMSDHLKKCPFNTVEHKTEPIPLPAMCTARDGHSLRHALRPIYL